MREGHSLTQIINLHREQLLGVEVESIAGFRHIHPCLVDVPSSATQLRRLQSKSNATPACLI